MYIIRAYMLWLVNDICIWMCGVVKDGGNGRQCHASVQYPRWEGEKNLSRPVSHTWSRYHHQTYGPCSNTSSPCIRTTTRCIPSTVPWCRNVAGERWICRPYNSHHGITRRLSVAPRMGSPLLSCVWRHRSSTSSASPYEWLRQTSQKGKCRNNQYRYHR